MPPFADNAVSESNPAPRPFAYPGKHGLLDGTPTDPPIAVHCENTGSVSPHNGSCRTQQLPCMSDVGGDWNAEIARLPE